jgi:uncharacterized protein YaaR (DUF327 family)
VRYQDFRGARLKEFHCITNVILYRYPVKEKVVSFLEEHLNIKSDSSESQSQTGEHLFLYAGSIHASMHASCKWQIDT